MARSFNDVFLNGGSEYAGDGYWLPHSSSIDFCETNYLHSTYIAECHNVWSSIAGLTVIGIIGLLHGNPLNEKRVLVLYVILAIIGLGMWRSRGGGYDLWHLTFHLRKQFSSRHPPLGFPILRRVADDIFGPWLPVFDPRSGYAERKRQIPRSSSKPGDCSVGCDLCLLQVSVLVRACLSCGTALTPHLH